MQKIAQHVSPKDSLHGALTTTVFVDEEYTVITAEDPRPWANSKTIIKFRNCPSNKESALQFQCSRQATGKRGAHFSFSLPAPLIEIFLERLNVIHTPPKI
jgi:hypothetical protein